MRGQAAGTAWRLVLASICLCFLASWKESRSTKILCEDHCSAYQHSDSLPDRAPHGVIRLAVGGDSRNDENPSQNRLSSMAMEASWTKPRKFAA
jgi:hypothetical protein